MIIKQCNKPAIKVWKVDIFEVNFNCFDKNIRVIVNHLQMFLSTTAETERLLLRSPK